MTTTELIAWAENHISNVGKTIKIDACSTILDAKEFVKMQLAIIIQGENITIKGRVQRNINYKLAVERLLKYKEAYGRR